MRKNERMISMKKLLCLFMAAVSVLTVLAGCAGKPADPTTVPTEVTQSPEEAAVYKVLMIGQSLAQDTIWLLYDVLKAEMPDKEFVVGDIYKSTDLGEHVENIKANAPVYVYYEYTEAGRRRYEDYTIDDALKGQQWDLIMFNDATYNTTQARDYEDGDHEFMIDHIRKTAAPGYRLAYNATGARPTSAELYTPGRAKAPENNRENLIARFDGGKRNLYYSMICANIEKYIETNEEFDLVFYTGTALQYASETHGVPEALPERTIDLYRDYVHLSDFGRLLVAYQLYAQIYGLEELTEVNVDVIKARDRATSREQVFGDLQITQEGKDAIIASVNYALKNPNTAPPQTAREPAMLEPLP